MYVEMFWNWLIPTQRQGGMSAPIQKKYPVFKGIYLFRGIYTDDMLDTGLSGKFCRGKMEKLTFWDVR